MNYPQIVKIKEVIKENSNVKTIKFEYLKSTKPGQFFMIWIPGIDEIPMSASYIDEKIKGFTFKKIGEATNKLFKFKIGQKIGIRGPYGNGYEIQGKNILFIGGGTGIATIAPSVEFAVNKKIKSTVIIGAKTKDELFFENRIKKTNSKIIITTDDGSKGIKGLATDTAKDLIKKEKIDQIFTCGPELMMKKLLDISNNIGLQVSLERYMKCGIGLCGQCCVGKGLRVCEEGPVFNKETLLKVEDFGKYKKDASGQKIKF